jgi:hypothetical protein
LSRRNSAIPRASPNPQEGACADLSLPGQPRDCSASAASNSSGISSSSSGGRYNFYILLTLISRQLPINRSSLLKGLPGHLLVLLPLSLRPCLPRHSAPKVPRTLWIFSLRRSWSST